MMGRYQKLLAAKCPIKNWSSSFHVTSGPWVHLKVMIYGARWKSHECPTRALSIPEVLPCLSDENKIVPTQISSLYAFLTLAPSLSFHSAPCYCCAWHTNACYYFTLLLVTRACISLFSLPTVTMLLELSVLLGYYVTVLRPTWPNIQSSAERIFLSWESLAILILPTDVAFLPIFCNRPILRILTTPNRFFRGKKERGGIYSHISLNRLRAQ